MPVIAEDNIVLRIIAETQKAAREIDQLDRRVDELEGSTSQVNDQFAKLGKFARNAAVIAVIAKMTQGMARFATASVKAYAEFEKTQKSFEVLVGDIGEANKLLDDLRKFSKDTPFGTQEVTVAAKTLLGFGRASTQVMDDIKRLGELSAATGADLTQVALVYGQVASLGKLQAQDALQFISAGVPVYDLLATSMNKSVGELKQLQAQGKITFADLEKAIREAGEEGGKFFGAIEAQSNTLQGLLNQITGGFEEIQIAIGEKFAPAVRASMRLIGTMIDRLLTWVEGIDDDFVLKISAGILTINEFFDSAIITVGSYGEVLRKAYGLQLGLIKGTVSFLGAQKKFWEGDMKGWWKGLGDSIEDVQEGAMNMLTAPFDYYKLVKELNSKRPEIAKTYNDFLKQLRSEIKPLSDGGGKGEDSLTKDLVLGKDPKKTENDLAKGVEALVKAALKAYAITTRELLGRSKAAVESTLQQRKEAQILSVFLARDLADMSAQEFRNFHKYASESLGSDNLITLMIEGYLKDAEGKEIDQDLVARIGGKLTDSIAKWTKSQKTGDDKKGFLQNLFGMSDKEFEDLKYTSDIILQSAVELTNSLVNEEIRRTDLLIQASRDRLQQLQAVAGEGNAEQLQLEEQRQRKLIEKRESYLQRQRQLNAIEITANNAVIVSNMIKGLSDAFKAGNVFGGIAYSIAAAATIATTIASVSAALASVPAYWKGTEFVTGEGGIDNVPAMLSKGERVVDRNTNSTLNRWGVKNDDLLPLVGSALGKYGPVSLFQGENVSRKEFKELSGKLERVEKAIYGIQFNVNIDPDGIGVAAGNYRNRQSKRNKLLS